MTRTRHLWLPALALGAAVSASFWGCGDEVEPPTGPTPTATTTSGSGGSGGAAACAQASDCPGTDTECRARSCANGVCGFTDAPLGTPVAQQTKGDCKQMVCDGAGAITTANDDGDPPDDGTACTVDACAGGVASHTDANAGSACSDSGGKICDGAGKCVECLQDTDCASLICLANACVAPSCTDGVKNGGETDIDCGGPSCPACISGKLCTIGGDCVTGVCTGGVCQGASCTDNVKNDVETDVDCGGGTCGPCKLGQKCFTGNDCASTLCTNNLCAQLNGCDPVTATDLTGMGAVSIDFGGVLGLVYSPKCIKVSAGTEVTFNGSFSSHPLKAGVVQNGAEIADAAGTTPLPTAAGGLGTGTTATFTMSSAGSFGYYCIPHGTFGMNGAIFVQ